MTRKSPQNLKNQTPIRPSTPALAVRMPPQQKRNPYWVPTSNLKWTAKTSWSRSQKAVASTPRLRAVHMRALQVRRKSQSTILANPTSRAASLSTRPKKSQNLKRPMRRRVRSWLMLNQLRNAPRKQNPKRRKNSLYNRHHLSRLKRKKS